MTGAPAGRVVELWRFPVKSFQGERVDGLALDDHGVAGDRDWALIDRTTGRLLSAKRHAVLFQASARTVEETVVVSLPDGTEVAADDPGASDRVSRWLGSEVELRHVDDHVQVDYEMTFDPPHDDAEVVTVPAPRGSFLDLAHVHLVSRGTLAGATAARPDLDWDVRRFRPNVVVDLGAGAAPFAEDAWVGTTVAVGAAGLHVDQATVRCAMPLRAQPGLVRQARLFDALQELHANHLGVYATVRTAGSIALDDPVTAG